MTQVEKQTFFSKVDKDSLRIEHEQQAAQYILGVLDEHGKQSDKIPMSAGRLGNIYKEVPGSQADLKVGSDRLVITKYDTIDFLQARFYSANPSKKHGWEYRTGYSLDFHATEGDLTSYSRNISDEQLEGRLAEARRIVEEYETTSRSKRLGQHAARKLAKIQLRKKIK